MAFDLSEYKAAAVDVADIDIVHPVTGQSLGMKIQVLSIDCDEYRKEAMRLQNENIRYYRKNRGKTTAERIAQEALDLLVAVTVGWQGLLENGQPVPFTKENCQRIYTDYPFIKEQVDEFVGDRRNFIRN